MAKPKMTKYEKQARRFIDNGHSIEKVVAWWNRLVADAEIDNGIAKFYLPVSKYTGKGCYRFTGQRQVEFEIAI